MIADRKRDRFLDALRQRGLQYEEHLAQLAPHVLDYEAELVCDGRSRHRPVNDLLVRIVPPQCLVVDETRRPFVIVDPRAGHGPGIGGFKADSEIRDTLAGRVTVAIDDVGAATAFLAHDAARLMTGQVLYIDGGYHIID